MSVTVYRYSVCTYCMYGIMYIVLIGMVKKSKVMVHSNNEPQIPLLYKIITIGRLYYWSSDDSW